MSIADARIQVQNMRALDALKDAGIDEETISRIESSLHAKEMINSAGSMLMSAADQGGVRNYISLEMVGMHAPFDRMFVELVRPGGKYSSEIADELRADVARLETRQQELLQLIANISQSTPLDSEVKEALEQRGILLAEIGTLRNAVPDGHPLKRTEAP